ncbi:MAG TPA: condensation domain-containing protein, partial [Legionellaceae bacterium]|nr:condensation domain-containing protein [Legionellaceae bacterium]
MKFNNIIDKCLPNPHHIYKTLDMIAPLAFSQERLWFIHNFEEGTSAYNITIAYELHKTIDLDLLKKALQSIMQRHSVLRSVIRTGRHGVEQHVISLEEQSVRISEISLEDMAALDWSLQQDERYIFDLSQDYPILFKLYLCEETYYLSLIVHHIAFDGWSIDIFVKELVEYYKYHKNKLYSPNLDALPIQYKDYALWQRTYLSGDVLAKQMSFWVTKLRRYQPLNLAYDKSRPLKIDYCGENVYFEVDLAITEHLRNLAKELKVTLYSILLSAYYLLLRTYSFQDDIVIGTPIANRHHEQAEDLIGFFVNTLAIRINAPHLSLQELIVKIGSDIFEAQSYQDLPFEKLVQELKIPKDTSRHPIFQVFFSVQNFGDRYDNETEDNFLIRNYSPNNTYNEAALFDLNLNIDDSKDVLKGYLNFAKSLFFRESIENMVATYCYLLQQLAAIDPKGSDEIESLQYIKPSNHEKLISTGHGIKENFLSNKTIHELFEDQVKLTPHHIAIIYEDIKSTYQELNNNANKLAHYL